MSALVAWPFELDAVEQRDAVGDRDEFEVAAAFGLEGLFDLRARTPFGGEALIGVDGELSSAGAGRQDREQRGCTGSKDKSVRIGASFIVLKGIEASAVRSV